MEYRPMNISRRTFTTLLVVATTVTLLHFLFHPVRLFGMDTSIFYMDEKVTIAAWFTAVVYFFAGFVAFVSLKIKKNAADRIARAGMGIFFLLLSWDEYFEVHEYINTFLKNAVSEETTIGGLLYFSWIFPFLLVIGAVLLSLFWAAKRETAKGLRKLLYTGLAMYGIILIMELVGGATYGQPIYLAMVGAEEGLEMVSATVFLRYMMESSRLFD